MSGKPQKLLITILVALLAVIALLVFKTGKAPSAPPLPQPNGYDDLVKAGGMLWGRELDYTTMSETELSGLVGTNSEALKAASTGLSHECRVPPDYVALTSGAHLSDLRCFKGLAQAFAADGRLAEAENRPGDAAAAYLTDIRLGQQAARGGVMIDSLSGLACEAIGTERLGNLVPTLDAGQCRETAAALEAVESRRESPSAVLEQEKAFARRAYGLKGEMVRLLTFRSIRQREQRYAAKVAQQQARNCRLLIDLAVRAFELEQGRRPATLDELVPTYLKAIPQGPYSGTNIVKDPRATAP
jgi:hypothetical protein